MTLTQRILFAIRNSLAGLIILGCFQNTLAGAAPTLRHKDESHFTHSSASIHKLWTPGAPSVTTGGYIHKAAFFQDGGIVTYQDFDGNFWNMQVYNGQYVSLLIPVEWLTNFPRDIPASAGAPAWPGLRSDLLSFLIDKLDQGYVFYRDLYGREPTNNPSAPDGRLRIAFRSGMSAAGLGLIGMKGIEIGPHFLESSMYAALEGKIQQTIFWHEFGRNFGIGFGDVGIKFILTDYLQIPTFMGWESGTSYRQFTLDQVYLLGRYFLTDPTAPVDGILTPPYNKPYVPTEVRSQSIGNYNGGDVRPGMAYQFWLENGIEAYKQLVRGNETITDSTPLGFVNGLVSWMSSNNAYGLDYSFWVKSPAWRMQNYITSTGENLILSQTSGKIGDYLLLGRGNDFVQISSVGQFRVDGGDGLDVVQLPFSRATATVVQQSSWKTVITTPTTKVVLDFVERVEFSDGNVVTSPEVNTLFPKLKSVEVNTYALGGAHKAALRLEFSEAVVSSLPYDFGLGVPSADTWLRTIDDTTLATYDYGDGKTIIDGNKLYFVLPEGLESAGRYFYFLLPGYGTDEDGNRQQLQRVYDGLGDIPRKYSFDAALIPKIPQTIIWNGGLSGAIGDSITLTATGGASGNAVTYAGTTGICTVNGSSLNLIGAGSCTVTASQAGNVNYNAATPVPKTFIVTSATVAISPASSAFPNQPINSTSALRSLQISNTGTINLTVTGANITGAAAADFAISNGCTTVAPSGSCTIAISFRPTTLGVKSASVAITSNASNSPTTVPLSGTGVAAAPFITLTPSALAFSNQLVGTTSATQALAIRNTGSAPMTISSLVLSGTNATAFVRTGNCTRVAVNATCTTSLSFRPTAAGAASATLTINSNAYQSAATQVPLSGTGIVTTISQLAGNIDGPGFVNGSGTAARFNGPSGVAVDASGNVFVVDNNNHVIRRITAAGAVTTLAGTPLQFGATNGTGAAARFNRPFGIAINGTTLTVADTGNHTIRRVTSAGAVTTLAGTAGAVGGTNGTGATARFSSPQGVVIDSTGVAFVADTGNSTIRRITSTGVTTTFSGTAGQPGNVDGTGAIARFSSPAGIARDNANILYVTDVAGQIIRRITTTGVVTTVAGKAGTAGTVDGTGVAAAFSSPTGAVVDATGNIFVADAGNGTVRKITPAGVVTTFAGTAGSQGSADGTGAAAMFYTPTGVARDAANNLYMADPVAHTIRRITPAGVVSTFAGFSAVVGANDNAGSLASFRGPTGIVSDAAGNLYVADKVNHTIRRITPEGVVTTFAGAAQAAGSADGLGTAARFSNPTGLAIDSSGNIYVADSGNHLIRRIAPDGTVTTVAGGAGLAGAVDGIGAAARFRSPSGLAVTGSGLLYVADTGNFTIRLVTLSTGQVATLAGSAGFTGTTNGTGAAARFGQVYGLATDSGGNVFAADFTASTIRRITPAGAVTLFAGTANARGTTNGIGTAARFSSPYALTIDATNTIYVTDYGNCMLRKITSAAAVTTAVGTAGTCRFTAGNAPGTVNTPMGITKQGTTVHFTAGNGVGRIVNMP